MQRINSALDKIEFNLLLSRAIKLLKKLLDKRACINNPGKLGFVEIADYFFQYAGINRDFDSKKAYFRFTELYLNNKVQGALYLRDLLKEEIVRFIESLK